MEQTNKLIEEKLQQFDKNIDKTIDLSKPNICNGWLIPIEDAEQIKQFLKTSLNEVVEAREKKILERIEFEAYEEGKTEGEMMLSLEDIKKIINK